MALKKPSTPDEAKRMLGESGAPGYVIFGILAAIEKGGKNLNGHEYNAIVQSAASRGVDIRGLLGIGDLSRDT